ncbi:hypothetical protein [Haloarchaeobius sp. DYHT-AS-18]|uniref:hypothetical protein n=1 Tax=Haloarchaeobius sp. DYHT-AS-18 TaxID=3446117 RepID=UPI003EBFA05C
MTDFSPLIKVTPECNLRCRYYHYSDQVDEYPDDWGPEDLEQMRERHAERGL